MTRVTTREQAAAEWLAADSELRAAKARHAAAAATVKTFGDFDAHGVKVLTVEAKAPIPMKRVAEHLAEKLGIAFNAYAERFRPRKKRISIRVTATSTSTAAKAARRAA